MGVPGGAAAEQVPCEEQPPPSPGQGGEVDSDEDREKACGASDVTGLDTAIRRRPEEEARARASALEGDVPMNGAKGEEEDATDADGSTSTRVDTPPACPGEVAAASTASAAVRQPDASRTDGSAEDAEDAEARDDVRSSSPVAEHTTGSAPARAYTRSAPPPPPASAAPSPNAPPPPPAADDVDTAAGVAF